MKAMNEENLDAVTGGMGKDIFLKFWCADCVFSQNGQVCSHQEEEAARAAGSGAGYYCSFHKKAAI